MKECKYCRTKYDDNLSACPSCGGTKVITEQEKAEDAALYQKEIENRENAIAVVATKRKLLISVLACIVVVIISVIALASYNANKPLSNGMTKEEGEAILSEGIAFYNDGDYESAIECFVQLPADSNQYAEAQNMLAKSKDSYRASVLERANAYTQSGDYENAFSLLENAQILLQGDADLEDAYANAYEANVADILSKSDAYVQSGELEVALELLQNAQSKWPKDVKLQNAYSSAFTAYKTLVKDVAISEADGYVENEDYVGAITTINTATEKIGHDDELAAKRAIYVDTYVSRTISAAKAQYIEYNYESIIAAENLLETALNVLPDNETLLAELVSYQEREPIKIIEMPATDTKYFYTSGQFSLVGDVEDCNGQEQMDTAKVELFASKATDDDHKWWWYCYKTIDIDFQYSKITGTLFQNPKYSGVSTTTQIEICGYKEENHYYETVIKDVSINGQSNPIVNFEVDVTGRKYIRIIFKGDYAVGSGDSPYEYAYVSELYLWK